MRDDVDDELAFHITERAEAPMALGETSEAAYARARRRRHMRDLIQDIAYPARKLGAAPVFTVAAVLTPAADIGATAAMFSVVDGNSHCTEVLD